jgi:hypothetical protein
MPGRRQEENTMYACMAMPPGAHKVESPADEPEADLLRTPHRRAWRRLFRRTGREAQRTRVSTRGGE